MAQFLEALFDSTGLAPRDPVVRGHRAVDLADLSHCCDAELAGQQLYVLQVTLPGGADLHGENMRGRGPGYHQGFRVEQHSR
ncbi:hypothetical protein [Candidatus Palauibacter sp.]|uniref:hypothetical protein n=1 Tax=Candidatus Palauibacter sp. TaxID=3101350 RepID=UPI003B5C86EB